MIQTSNRKVHKAKHFLKNCQWWPEATTGDPSHDKVMWKRTVKQGFRTQRAPQAFSSIYPKTRICLFFYFMTFTNSSDINRGLTLTTFLWKKINLGLQLKSVLDMKKYFQSKPLCQHFSLLGRYIQTLTATHVIIYSLPTAKNTKSLKHRAFQRVKSYQSSANARF